MTTLRKLNDDEVQAHLAATPHWDMQDGKLRREFRFDNFVDAFTFMTSLAFVAEEMNHHPEWFNVYNRVVIDLNTHDVNGLSTHDFHFAAKANQLYSRHSKEGG